MGATKRRLGFTVKFNLACLIGPHRHEVNPKQARE